MKISRCKRCDENIVWLVTANGNKMPVDADTVQEGDEEFSQRDGHVSHFDTCPYADEFRKKK